MNLTLEDFVIANFFVLFLAACYIISGMVDGEYPATVWFKVWMLYAAVATINFSALLSIRDNKQQHEDHLMRNDTYIAERLKWLKEATKILCRYPPPHPDARMSQVAKVAKQYRAMEKLLRRYRAWEERNTRSNAIRDWDAKREFIRKWEFCYMMRSALNYRKVALLGAAFATTSIRGTKYREQATSFLSVEYTWVARSIQNFWDDGWEDWIRFNDVPKKSGTTEQAELFEELQMRYFGRAA